MADTYSEMRSELIALKRKAEQQEQALRYIQRRLNGPADGKIRDIRAKLDNHFAYAPGKVSEQ